MAIKKINYLDDFYEELKDLHKQLCPDYSFAELWHRLTDNHKKVDFNKIKDDRILLLLRIVAFNLSINYSDEKWKPIKDYSGRYEVSNKGRVRRNNGIYYTAMHYDISPLGYKRVNLSKDNDAKKHLVSRLVAEAFIENPNNYPIINHKDEQPWNNTVENLEWCTYQYNNAYNGLNKKRFTTRSKNIFAKKYNIGKPVVQLSLDGDFIKEWQNAEWAYRELGISSSSIGDVCKHLPHHNTAGGFKWMYKDEYNRIIEVGN